jgi:rubrerythrin
MSSAAKHIPTVRSWTLSFPHFRKKIIRDASEKAAGHLIFPIELNKMHAMAKKFQRKAEDFICDNCGAAVKGGGYTNHCPHCLCSKDADINPGDRASKCGGLMRPAAIEVRRGGYVIVHRCEKCGKERRNKSAPNDNFDMILAVMKSAAAGALNGSGS